MNHNDIFTPMISLKYTPFIVVPNHCFLTFLIIVKLFFVLLNTQAWARREALAREAVIANGGEIQFGVYYNNKQYDEGGDCGDSMPTIKESE
jgi:hypothetical protein